MAEAPVEIDPRTFPGFLVDLHHKGATGSLKVKGPTHDKQLYFRGGRILFGSSNDPADQLGAILIASGRLTTEQLDDVTRKTKGSPLARALADSGLVSQRELSEAARAKVERIVSDVLSYAAGTYEFEDGVLPKGAVDLKLSTERLIIAAVRRIADRSFVLRHLDGLDVVLCARPELQERLAEIHTDTGGLQESLDGSRTLKEAAAAVALDEFEAAKVACALLFLGLVERASASDAAQSPFFLSTASTQALDIGDSPTVAMAAPTAVADEPTVLLGRRDSGETAEATVVMEAHEAPAWMQPGAPPTPAEEPVVVMESETQPLPSAESPPRVEAPPAGPPPLRIIEPPKPSERSRPPSKPTREDLAALDALLSSKPVEGPLAPLAKEPEHPVAWAPEVASKPAKPQPRAPARAVSGNRAPLLVGGILVVTALALGGWYLQSAGYLARFTGPRTASAPTSSVPARPSPRASVAPSAAAFPASASAAPTSPTPSGTPPSAAAAPSPTLPPPTTTTLPPAKPTPAPPAPQRAGSPSAPKTAAGSGGTAGARELLRKGNYPEAAREFAASLEAAGRGAYTVQILLACQEDTITKALANVSADDLFILAMRYQGRDCFRLCWGVYETESSAETAVRAIPGYFEKGGSRPKVVSARSILR